jgi:hypothetical protein
MKVASIERLNASQLLKGTGAILKSMLGLARERP